MLLITFKSIFPLIINMPDKEQPELLKLTNHNFHSIQLKIHFANHREINNSSFLNEFDPLAKTQK